MPIVKVRDLGDLPDIGQLVVAPWGTPGCGKTHFALTFPEPIRIINLDFGLKEVLPKFKSKDIKWADFLITRHEGQHTRMLLDIVDTYEAFLEELQPTGGTIVVDTVTQLWQLVQSVKLEEIKVRRAKKKGVDPDDIQVHQFDWAQCNSWQGAFLRSILSTQYARVNGVFISRASAEYVGNEATGRQAMQGYKELQSIVQLVIEIFEFPRREREHLDGRVHKCRFDLTRNGEPIPQEGLNYEYLRDAYL